MTSLSNRRDRAGAAWRRVRSEFAARGEAAIERWKQEDGGHSVDQILADLQMRLDEAKHKAGDSNEHRQAIARTVEDRTHLEDFAIERELGSETLGWTIRQRALDALREGISCSLLSRSPYSCRPAELGNGRSHELIIPFGGTVRIVLFETIGDDFIVAAIRL